MIAYVDTSGVVALLIEEPGSAVAERIWVAADRLVSSRLLFAEGRAALAQARRMGRLTAQQHTQCRREFTALVTQVAMVEITEALVDRAGDLAETFGLRGYDAVHLAAAEPVADDDLVLLSGDRALLAAASELGIATAATC